MTAEIWMAIARGEIGVRSFPPGASNPRIDEYHALTNVRGQDDKVSWCSSYLNWVFEQAGIQGTGSALARSWLAWGEALEAPQPGCVVVLYRDDPASWKGHVGFYVTETTERVVLLGGNQLGEVREHDYAVETVLGYRWPAGGGR